MKKSAKLKRKTTKMVVKNLIVFAVLIAVAAVGVSSWFNEDEAKKASASGLNVRCSMPDGMQVAVLAPGTTPSQATVWHDETFSLDTDSYASIFSALSMTEVTGDGITFIRPPLTQYSTVATPNKDKTWGSTDTQTFANSEYMSFDLYFRTPNSGCKVKLDEETYLGPPSPNQDYGNSVNGWSPNSVIGATRMSIVGDNNTSRKLLWIPAPFLYFNGTTLSTNVTDTGNTYGLSYVDGESHTQILHSDGTYNHGYYNLNKTRSIIKYGNNPATNVTANTNKDYKLHKDIDIATLDKTAEYYVSPTDSTKSTYYTNHVRVNIWIEGEDPESRSTQVKGIFKAVLNLELAPVG